MKYYIIAGEASGDLHASNLIREIAKKDPQAQFRAWGGELMKAAGATLVKHINELAFMGFSEVIINIRTILANIRFCKKDILQYNPDVVIFVDYPGFNLRIARYCKENQFKTVYYISPTVWAWNKSRIKAIKRDVDKMMVILPFEKAFYDKHSYPVEFVGHPLLDALDLHDGAKPQTDLFKHKHSLPDKAIIALLPGSRKQEISLMLPPMAAAAARFPQYQFVVAGTSAHSPEYYQQFLGKSKIPVLYGQTYPLLQNAYAALVTSGTATLETALIGTPQVVCYKAGFFSYQIAKRLVDLKYISLVNLIMDEQVVTELIQEDLNLPRLQSELEAITLDQKNRRRMIDKYAILREKLGGRGASEKAAEIVVSFANQ